MIVKRQTKRRAFLALEELESRWVPATIHFGNGTLSITNLVSTGAPGPTTTLTILQSAATANTFSVFDGTGASTFTFAGVSNVLVDTGNGRHNVTFDSNGSVYTGNLTINAHNGNDLILVVNSAGSGGILGSTTVLTSTGNDTIAIGNFGGTAMTFGGNVVGVNGSLTQIGNLVKVGTTSILGSLSITDAQQILLTEDLAQVRGGTSLQDGGIGASTIHISGPTTFGKFLNITGGATSSAPLNLAGFSGITVNGSTNITQGTGNDTFSIANASTFNGNFNYTELGSGSDSVSIVTGQTFDGNASFNLGNGTDTFTMAGTTSTINGNLSIQAGNGNDSITTGAAVFGNLFMQLGNGNDTVAVNSTAALGGLFSLNAGNGNSSVSLTPGSATAFNIAFRFGTGTDTLTLGATASTISGSLLSQNPGGNDFDNSGGWTILPPWTSNF